jgi:integrase
VSSIERYETKSGPRYAVRFRDAERRQTTKRGFVTRRDAKQFAAGVETKVINGAYVRPSDGRVTVGVLAAEYLAGRQHLKPKSVESLRSLLDAQVLPRWRDVPISSITPSAVQSWVSGLSAAGLSSSRARQSAHAFKSVLAVAVRDRRLVANPADLVDLPRLVTARGHRYLSADELHRLADAAGQWADLVYVLGTAGLRWGEATALRVRDVHFLRRRLEVNQSTVEVSGKLITGLPKNSQRRSVSVSAEVLEMLSLRVAGKSPDDLVFTTLRGQQLRSQNFARRVWAPAVAAAGLGPLRVHELRHTAVSIAVDAGADVLAVARMLGHADPSITLKRYAGLFDTGIDRVGTSVGAVLWPVGAHSVLTS